LVVMCVWFWAEWGTPNQNMSFPKVVKNGDALLQ
jgi:hypothetical protein